MQNIWRASICAVLFFTAACTPQVIQGSSTIEVVMSSSGFQPMQWVVPAGEQITVNVQNTTTEQHSWTLLERFPRPDASPDDPLPSALFRTQIEPESKQTFTFSAPLGPGEYRVLCDLHFEENEPLLGVLLVENNP